MAVLLSACTVNMGHMNDPPRQLAFTTAGAWNSMVYIAATDSGAVAIDLGWTTDPRGLEKALGSLGKTPADVAHVFITHSHRDHVAGWPLVSQARFHLHEDEVPLFVGEQAHRDFPSRVVERLRRPNVPAPNPLRVEAFSRDTVFDLGEPLVAYPVPGHTPGSVAYLFRGVLFVGDAVSHMPVRGFHGAATLYSHDMELARESLRALFRDGIDPDQVEWVCTAHGKCSRPTPEFIEKVTR